MHGTRGSFVKHGLDPQEAALKLGVSPRAPDFGEEPPEAYGFLTPGEDRLGECPPRLATIAPSMKAWRARFWTALRFRLMPPTPAMGSASSPLAGRAHARVDA